MSKFVVTCLTPGATFDRATVGLLGEAERIAQALDAEHKVLASASDQPLLERCSQHSDQVIAIEDPEYQQYHPESCLAVLHEACQKLKPQCILLGQDTYSQEVSARLAHRLGGCSIADAQRLELNEGKIRATRSVYGGKANALIQANASPAVIWLRARAFAPQPARSEKATVETSILPQR